jgi:hypothetical protein
MAALLFFLGLFIFVVGGLMFLVAWFSVSILWGLGCLFIPLVSIVFVFAHWDKAKTPLLAQVIGLILMVSALFVGGENFTRQYSVSFQQYMSQNYPDQYKKMGELPSGDMLPSIKDLYSPDAEESDGNSSQSLEANTPLPGQKVIHKCVDAKGRVTYTEQRCANDTVKTINIKPSL